MTLLISWGVMCCKTSTLLSDGIISKVNSVSFTREVAWSRPLRKIVSSTHSSVSNWSSPSSAPTNTLVQYTSFFC